MILFLSLYSFNSCIKFIWHYIAIENIKQEFCYGTKKGFYTDSKTYDEIEEATGYERGTIQVYKHVSDNVPSLMRIKDVSFQHHQLMREALLYAEAKMGELLKDIPKPKFDKQLNGSLRRTTETLPSGISKKQSHYAQTLKVGIIKPYAYL